MTALEDARAALASHAMLPPSPERGGGLGLAAALRALIAEHEALLAAPPKRGTTISDRIAFDAAVSIRAREIVDAREMFQAVAAERAGYVPVSAFNDFRDAEDGWQQRSPFEIAWAFWKGGICAARSAR